MESNYLEETAPLEERTAFFQSVRQSELDRLVKGIERKQRQLKAKEMESKNVEETASFEERMTFFKSVRQAELDRLMKGVEREQMQMKAKEMNSNTSEEMAPLEERTAFFQSVRQSELDRLMKGIEREQRQLKSKDLQKVIKKTNTEKLVEETAPEAERVAFAMIVREAELERLQKGMEREDKERQAEMERPHHEMKKDTKEKSEAAAKETTIAVAETKHIVEATEDKDKVNLLARAPLTSLNFKKPVTDPGNQVTDSASQISASSPSLVKRLFKRTPKTKPTADIERQTTNREGIFRRIARFFARCSCVAANEEMKT